MQAIVAKLHKLIKQNLGFRLYRRLLINENKWRASRYGLEGKMIDFGKKEEVDTPILIHELLEFVDDVVDELDSRDELKFIHNILEMGTGARRQLQVWNKTNNLGSVVDYIIAQTNTAVNGVHDK
jgi:carboxylate-amine ligase